MQVTAVKETKIICKTARD